MKTMLVLFITLAVLLGGCAAPKEVQVAQQLQRQAILSYAQNNHKIFSAYDTIYTQERNSNISFTVEQAIALIAAHAKDGKVSVEDAQAAARAVANHLEQANAETEQVRSRMRTTQLLNDNELVKVLRLTDALSGWMNAGPTTEAIDELTTGLLDALQSRQAGTE